MNLFQNLVTMALLSSIVTSCSWPINILLREDERIVRFPTKCISKSGFSVLFSGSIEYPDREKSGSMSKYKINRYFSFYLDPERNEAEGIGFNINPNGTLSIGSILNSDRVSANLRNGRWQITPRINDNFTIDYDYSLGTVTYREVIDPASGRYFEQQKKCSAEAK